MHERIRTKTFEKKIDWMPSAWMLDITTIETASNGCSVEYRVTIFHVLYIKSGVLHKHNVILYYFVSFCYILLYSILV